MINSNYLIFLLLMFSGKHDLLGIRVILELDSRVWEKSNQQVGTIGSHILPTYKILPTWQFHLVKSVNS